MFWPSPQDTLYSKDTVETPRIFSLPVRFDNPGQSNTFKEVDEAANSLEKAFLCLTPSAMKTFFCAVHLKLSGPPADMVDASKMICLAPV
ncbi:hypothetical protein PoB_000486400 [Plakobranchus ocellatus]|uniref:Uncharacterized protein n=1 Tax=Plakobranchus ocellatus TaxID=259542 RepID=A0AAV3Y603_9GAST|nr:hypothetical protein PoB_000486400 [Plakobranchus ocellatus]